MAVYGYARVSTADQSLERQIAALRGRGIAPEAIHTETASGDGMRRPVLDHLRSELLEPGDTLVIHSLDRLSRRTAHIIVLLDELHGRGIRVESLHEALDTGTPDGRFQINLLGALAQREREILAERTREGLAAARAQGKLIGRPVRVTRDQHENVLALRDSGWSHRRIASATGLSASTVARIIRGTTAGHAGYRSGAEPLA